MRSSVQRVATTIVIGVLVVGCAPAASPAASPAPIATPRSSQPSSTAVGLRDAEADESRLPPCRRPSRRCQRPPASRFAGRPGRWVS